jgi:Domain of unknown function (DUF4389)
MSVPASAYPAVLTDQPPERIANWRPLVQWLLAIPHFVVVYVLGAVAEILAIISWFAILFTGRLPKGIADFQCLYLRYSARTWFYAGFLSTPYPPFSFDGGGADQGDYPTVRVDVTPALEDRNRVTTFFRLLMVIPHLLVLIFVSIAAWVVWIVGFFAVLFTGTWPEGLRNFAVGALRWSTRVSAYLYLLTDEYPPFSLD